jgi:Fe(3+) dicitrate transport protein
MLHFGDLPVNRVFLLLAIALFGVSQVGFAQSASNSAVQPPGAAQGRSAAEAELEIVTVLGRRERLAGIPGSNAVIDASELAETHVMTTSEALRKAAGVNVRDEEGFGLRPNIGMRGLNPTRSTKTLLLEDGIPLAYAPYGDNASYYHPPIDRFARIEVLKGAGMNLYGPQTIGGVINYITPTPPEEREGLLRFTGGNRGYANTHARIGGSGLLLDLVDKRGDGARDNLDSTLHDYNAKYLGQFGDAHTVILRANRYEEESDLTYSGITDAELHAFGDRYNPFDNDTFKAHRNGLSLSHDWSLASGVDLTTSVYWSEFSRDWWRQASTTSDSQCNAVIYQVAGVALNFAQARAAGYAVDPDDCASHQGRLRDYRSFGIEPRLRVEHTFLGLDSELVAGFRAHGESQHRKQVNAASAEGKTGTLVERNERETTAYAAFVQQSVSFGALEISPGMHFERIDTTRDNELAGSDGRANLDEWLPSLGFSYLASDRLTVFGGLHRGFAPPRTEDLIDNSGVVTDVSPEESLNAELGLRYTAEDGSRFEATAFRNGFDNQIVVGSIAGGSTPLAEGEALYEGLEVSAYTSRDDALGPGWSPFAQFAWTWLPTADIRSPFTRVDTGVAVPGAEDGNRLPYAPEHLLTASVGLRMPAGFDVHLEMVYVDEQFADFSNTRQAPIGGNGQIGRIDDYLIWNVAANWNVPGQRFSFFVTVKNLGDESYIVDRTRGIQTAPPRLLQAGAEFRL